MGGWRRNIWINKNRCFSVPAGPRQRNDRRHAGKRQRGGRRRDKHKYQNPSGKQGTFERVGTFLSAELCFERLLERSWSASEQPQGLRVRVGGRLQGPWVSLRQPEGAKRCPEVERVNRCRPLREEKYGLTAGKPYILKGHTVGKESSQHSLTLALSGPGVPRAALWSKILIPILDFLRAQHAQGQRPGELIAGTIGV